MFPAMLILSPIIKSLTKYPKLNPIAFIYVLLLLFNDNFKCLPSDKALIESIFKFLKAKIGVLFPSPIGSSNSKLSTISLFMLSIFITLSILIEGIISSKFAFFEISSNLSFNKGIFSFLILSPTAILWPPNPSKISLHSVKASCKSNPGMLLPEPLPISSPFSKQTSKLGL